MLINLEKTKAIIKRKVNHDGYYFLLLILSRCNYIKVI